MTNGEKFIEVFGDTTVLFDTYDNDTTIHQSGNWWDEEYKQSNSDGDCIQPKTAKWQRVISGSWIYESCTSCGSIQDVKSNYCPNCGAKMEESEDGGIRRWQEHII